MCFCYWYSNNYILFNSTVDLRLKWNMQTEKQILKTAWEYCMGSMWHFPVKAALRDIWRLMVCKKKNPTSWIIKAVLQFNVSVKHRSVVTTAQGVLLTFCCYWSVTDLDLGLVGRGGCFACPASFSSFCNFFFLPFEIREVLSPSPISPLRDQLSGS